MSWEPVASEGVLETRARINADIRAFFQERNVLEVETPIINSYAVTDQQIESIATEHAKFLHTSPEYAMKRMLAFYKRDIFQLCKVFRANEQGRQHHHEFTMLEWYRIAWGYKKLMQEVVELIKTLLDSSFDSLEVSYFKYQQLFEQYVGIDISHATQADYIQTCTDHSIQLNSALTVQQYQEFVLDQIIIPKFGNNHILFIYEYPAEQAALARLNTKGNAERFECYLNGFELANGFQELADAKQQQSRFEEDNRKRLQENRKAIEIDKNFISALAAGLPESAGVALGVDRLLMIILGIQDIREVLAFPNS